MAQTTQSGFEFAGPGRRSAIRDWLALGLWLSVTAGYIVWCSSTGNFGPAHLAAGVALVVAFALLTQSGLVRLLGPVLFYDLLRNARRGRFILMRWLYAIGLLVLLMWVYWVWSWEARIRGEPTADYKALSRLAEQYFVAFSITQFCIVALLTPAYVAGGIAEEKERKTLEFLLATDLQNREIVFGKLISRLGNLALFIMTGLPVLSLMQFFGGIDPGLLLASFATTAITAASLAGLSILNSTLRRRARDAIILTYLAAIGYLALTGVTQFIKLIITNFGMAFAGGIDWVWFIDAFQSGNPLFGVYNVAWAVQSNGPLASTIRGELAKYAVFHSIVAVGSVTWAVLRLRIVALSQVAVVARRPRGLTKKVGRRHPIGLQPMFWKELWIEGRLRFGAVSRVLLGLLVAGGFAPVFIILYISVTDLNGSLAGMGFTTMLDRLVARWDDIGYSMNVWLRCMNVVISSLMLLGVAVRAAGSIGIERDRDTLVSLMTTPLTTRDIVAAKWAGALWSARGFLWWLGSVWLLALIFGGVNPMALLLHVAAWTAPAACFASVGLWMSSVARTTLRATAWTIGLAILLGGGHWICMGMCCYTPLRLMTSGSGRDYEFIAKAELAVTPPFTLGWDAFRKFEQLEFDHPHDNSMAGFFIAGLVFWAIGAAVMYSVALAQFERITNRGLLVPRLPPAVRAKIVRGPKPKDGPNPP